MSEWTYDFFGWAVRIGYATMFLALLLAFVRMVKGPTLPDRVVALDLVAILSAGVIALYAIAAEQPVYLDVAITLTLIAFLSTVAFARYVQQTGTKKEGERQ